MIKLFRNVRKNLVSDKSSIKRTSNYFKYAIGEIVLVVLGILIALQINNWNEDRKTSQQEVLYLNRLLSDMKEDIVTFTTSLQDLEKGKQTVVNFSEALKNDSSADSLLLRTALDYFKYGSIYPIFTWSNSTFQDLSSTGNLNVFSNSILQESIVKHYSKYKQIEERNKIATNWAIPLDGAFTFENDIMKFEPSTTFLFPVQTISDLAKELKIKKVSYISNAAAHYWINNDAINELSAIRIETETIITSLEEELRKN